MTPPQLEPPFLGELRPAADPTFPVRITARAQRALFGHIVNAAHYAGPALGFADGAVRTCDTAAFADGDYLVSKFGRVPVGVLRAEADSFRNLVLDRRSFPPGPPCLLLKTAGPSEATRPGRLSFAPEKLRPLHPELFQPAGLVTRVLTPILATTSTMFGEGGQPGWLGRLLGVHDPDGQCEAIETIAEKLWSFNTGPALVLAADPCVVAAYSAEIDGVVLLRLPESLGYQAGDRLITCNGYDQLDKPSGDIRPGPHSISTWNECWCVLADPLTDDAARLAELKADIPAEQWERCRELGEAKVKRGDDRRDGRPWLSRVAVRDQNVGCWRRRGGYGH